MKLGHAPRLWGSEVRPTQWLSFATEVSYDLLQQSAEAKIIYENRYSDLFQPISLTLMRQTRMEEPLKLAKLLPFQDVAEISRSRILVSLISHDL
jgi:hypothetical protein